MKQELKDQLYFFGYTNNPEIEHNTAFFEYETHDEADLATFNEFRRVNEKSLAAVTQQLPDAERPDYHFNTKDFLDADGMRAVPMCFNDLTFDEPE